MNKFWETAVWLHNRLVEHDIDYCFIKTYHDEQYHDGNIDLLTSSDRYDVANLLNEYYCIGFKDRIKGIFYERNKLMLTSRGNFDGVKVHIHNAVGWHNYDFIRPQLVLKDKITYHVDDNSVYLSSYNLERYILFLHAIIERFSFSEADVKFLTNDYIVQEIKKIDSNAKDSSFTYTDDIYFQSLLRLFLNKCEDWSIINEAFLFLLKLKNKL